MLLLIYVDANKQANKQTKSVVLVRKRTIPKLVPTFADRGYCVVSATDPKGRILGSLDRSRYYFFQVVPLM
jgi:hypothetical protein